VFFLSVRRVFVNLWNRAVWEFATGPRFLANSRDLCAARQAFPWKSPTAVCGCCAFAAAHSLLRLAGVDNGATHAQQLLPLVHFAATPRLTERTRTTAACVITKASPSPRKASPRLGGRLGSDSTIGIDSDADSNAYPCDDAPTSLDEVQQDLERNAQARIRRTNSGNRLTDASIRELSMESVSGGLPGAVLPRSNSLEKLNALVDDPKHFDDLLKDASVTTKHFESEIERELEDMMGEATLAKNALAADSGSQQAEILRS
jgi:hypothetical protein